MSAAPAASPAWVRCDLCEDYWCRVHGCHAHECRCPDLEDWPESPYLSGGPVEVDDTPADPLDIK